MFHLNNNSLSGHIPPQLSNLSNLLLMLLDNNDLTGHLPPEFSNIPELRILEIEVSEIAACMELYLISAGYQHLVI
ncbi:unnamed protein product [Camellia sinensis]